MRVVIIENEKNLGVAAGNNQGIHAALADGCEYVLLLNNDTILAPDILDQLQEGLVRHDCDMVTCKMYYHDNPEFIWCAGGHFQRWWGLSSAHDGAGQKDIGQYNVPRRVTYTPTCCLLARRSVFDLVGFMDDRYFAYYDDSDFLLRCLKRGIQLWYIPQGMLWHKVSSLTSSCSDFTTFFYARNHVYYVHKHLSRVEARLWYWIDQFRFCLSVLLLRSSIEKWNIRRKAAIEGWDMKIFPPFATNELTTDTHKSNG
jgi:hypothetical protein